MKNNYSKLQFFIYLFLILFSCQNKVKETVQPQVPNFTIDTQQLQKNKQKIQGIIDELAVAKVSEENIVKFEKARKELDDYDIALYHVLARKKIIEKSKALGEDTSLREALSPFKDSLFYQMNEYAIKNYGTSYYRLSREDKHEVHTVYGFYNIIRERTRALMNKLGVSE